MKPAPTDLELLNAIHERYFDAFAAFDEARPTRSTKIYVPVDIQAVARELDVDPDIVFGRLHYHLNEKYGYQQPDGAQVSFFAMRVGGDRHCIHFPYLSSIVGQLRNENRKYRRALTISVVSLCLSLVSLGVSVSRR
jgi:hypothetical protein